MIQKSKLLNGIQELIELEARLYPMVKQNIPSVMQHTDLDQSLKEKLTPLLAEHSSISKAHTEILQGILENLLDKEKEKDVY
ncbi:MAG: hypothetical protein ACI9CF_001650 [Candidatus Omnitrophota bacterium]|jgi:hypothetical protein